MPESSAIIKRRARQKHDIESDDPIDREVETDPDDNQSSLDSESDHFQLILPDGHSQLSTPNTTQSAEELTPPQSDASPKGEVKNPFFGNPKTWSALVAGKDANSPDDLPVVDFANLHLRDVDRPRLRARRRWKGTKIPPTSPDNSSLSVAEDRNGNGNDTSSSYKRRDQFLTDSLGSGGKGRLHGCRQTSRLPREISLKDRERPSPITERVKTGASRHFDPGSKSDHNQRSASQMIGGTFQVRRRNRTRNGRLLDGTAFVPRVTSVTSDSMTIVVKCMARTRIPTQYGPAFLHLYKSNRDDKDHLAIVVDPAQLSESTASAPAIRSRSLDATWSETETEMDRIIRGAYTGQLTPASYTASVPLSGPNDIIVSGLPPPLVRIHSECFTGETVGSMRCDCGEQLEEAMRLMFQPVAVGSSAMSTPGRGAVIYLRQEGRGIGLLSKIRAYNLQDMGHDTVTANLMLGHGADEREYGLAAAILRDLGLGTDGSEGVQLLTNNPEKVLGLEKEGVRVVKSVGMVPRSWQRRLGEEVGEGRVVDGEDLDRYLRTKVVRMGHMLPLVLG